MKSIAQVRFSTGAAASGCRIRLGTRRVVKPRPIQSERAVHAMHMLVVLRAPFGPHPIKSFQKPHRGYRATTSVSAAITASSR